MKAHTGDKLLIQTRYGTQVAEYLYPLASATGPSEYRHKIYMTEHKRVLTLQTDGVADPVVVQEETPPETVVAQDAPIGVPLWSCEGQAGFVTVKEVRIVRDKNGTRVIWIHNTGDERWLDLDEEVAVKLDS